MVVLLDVQVPPVPGVKVVVLPEHMVEGPVTETVGLPLIVMAADGLDAQPVAELVKVKVTEPAAMAVTTPELLIVATLVLLEDQVPPLDGDIDVVEPAQMGFAPVMETVGLGLTVIKDPAEVAAPQPIPVCVIETL